MKKAWKNSPSSPIPISWTTRPPREGEREGDFYYFITEKQFEKLKEQGEFLEWAKVHNDFYATSKKEVERLWIEGKAIIKDIDVQGCRSIKKIFPHSISVFIYPPSLNELKKRILKRDPSLEEGLEERLSIAAEEMAQGREYDFKIVNDSFEDAWKEFQKILVQSFIKSFFNKMIPVFQIFRIKRDFQVFQNCLKPFETTFIS